MLDEVTRLVAIVICVALGSAVQSTCGVGLALVAVPGLILIEPRMIPGPMLSASLLLSCLMVRREWPALDRRGLAWALVGRGLGTVPAVLLLPILSSGDMATVAGAMLLIGVALSMQTRVTLRPGAATLCLAGMISSVMGTVSAIGGPAMGLVYRREEMPRLRSTLAAFFIFGTMLSLLALAATGHYGRPEISLSLLAIPGVLLGWSLGEVILVRVSQETLRQGVLFLATAGGLLALARSW